MPNEAKPLEGQVAVVTGASRGIGRAIAVDFARAGADVVVSARSSESAPSKLPGTIEQTAREVEAEGRRALAVATDVTDEAQVRALAERTLAEFGRIDILVNNAGISFPAPFAQTPLKRWDLVMNVNLRGPVMCTQAFLPKMLEMISYSVSKIALEKLTQYLAEELQPKGIAVNALRIELMIATEGWQYRNPDVDYSDWAKPQEASEATLWLASRDPPYTGRVIPIAEGRQQMAAG